MRVLIHLVWFDRLCLWSDTRAGEAALLLWPPVIGVPGWADRSRTEDDDPIAAAALG